MSVTKYFNKKVRRGFLGRRRSGETRREEGGGWRIKRSGTRSSPITKELVEKSSAEMRRQTQCGHSISGQTKSSYGVSSRARGERAVELGLLSFQVRSSKDHLSQGGGSGGGSGMMMANNDGVKGGGGRTAAAL